MKNSIIISTLVVSGLSALSCNKVEQTPPANQKISLQDSVTAQPKLSRANQDATAEKIAHYIANDYLTPEDLKVIGMNERKFRYQSIDLNGDGKMEVFVSFFTPYFCGSGGCTVLLLDDALKPVTRFTVTRPPFYTDSKTENGWSVLYLKNGDQWKKLTYQNGSYPKNPSMVKSTNHAPDEKATEILPDDIDTSFTF